MKPTKVIMGSGWTSSEGETSFEVRIVLPVSSLPKSIASGSSVPREDLHQRLKTVLEQLEVP